MILKKQLERAVTAALADPALAASRKAFEAALERALRDEGAIDAPEAAAIAREMMLSESLRRGLLQSELVRAAEKVGVHVVAPLWAIGETLFREISLLQSPTQLRHRIAETLILSCIMEERQARQIAEEVLLDLVMPNSASFDTATSSVRMEEEALREQLFSMMVSTLSETLTREQAAEEAEAFLLMLLGPPEGEPPADGPEPLIHQMSDEITRLVQYADHPRKRQQVIAAIEALMAAHVRPNIDTFLFIKLMNSHGLTFIETIQSALASGGAGKEFTQQVNLHI